MAVMLNLQNVLKRLSAKQKAALDASKKVVVVGYTQSYAVHVHENLKSYHPNGQAKFLEQPARQMAKELGLYIKAEIQAGKKVTAALLKAGLKLQRASQELVPVLTGALKNSAFTRIEDA